MSNSPRNGSELAKTVSVDDGHVNASRESSVEEIALGRQNGPELAKIVSVDDRHVNAPRVSSIVEITLGPQNSE